MVRKVERLGKPNYEVEATGDADIIEIHSLTPEARELWWQYLEDCERGAERARRILGVGKESIRASDHFLRGED